MKCFWSISSFGLFFQSVQYLLQEPFPTCMFFFIFKVRVPEEALQDNRPGRDRRDFGGLIETETKDHASKDKDQCIKTGYQGC